MDNEQIYDYTDNEQKKSAKPVVSLVLGILSILWFPGLIFSIVGLVLGNQSTKNGLQPAGVAKAGKITSIIGLVLSIFNIILSIIGTIIGLIIGFAPLLALLGIGAMTPVLVNEPYPDVDPINNGIYDVNNNYGYDDNWGYDDNGYGDDWGYDDNGYGDDWGYDDNNGGDDWGYDDNNGGDDWGYDDNNTGNDTSLFNESKPVYNADGELIGYESDIFSSAGQLSYSMGGVTFIVPSGYSYGYGDPTYAVYMQPEGDYEFPAYNHPGLTEDDYYDYLEGVGAETVYDSFFTMYNEMGDSWNCNMYTFYNQYDQLTIGIYAVCENEDTCVILMVRPHTQEDVEPAASNLIGLVEHMYCECHNIY